MIHSKTTHRFEVTVCLCHILNHFKKSYLNIKNISISANITKIFNYVILFSMLHIIFTQGTCFESFPGSLIPQEHRVLLVAKSMSSKTGDVHSYETHNKIEVCTASPVSFPENETSTHWAIVQVTCLRGNVNLKTGLGHTLWCSTISQVLTPYSPLSHTQSFLPRLLHTLPASLSSKPLMGHCSLSGHAGAANRCWVCPMPAASSAWVDAGNGPWD